MIIVAGRIFVRPEQRSAFLERSTDAIHQARRTEGCLDFVVAADPLDVTRINVFEKWIDRATLQGFRENGPEDELSALIVQASVTEYEVVA